MGAAGTRPAVQFRTISNRAISPTLTDPFKCPFLTTTSLTRDTPRTQSPVGMLGDTRRFLYLPCDARAFVRCTFWFTPSQTLDYSPNPVTACREVFHNVIECRAFRGIIPRFPRSVPRFPRSVPRFLLDCWIAGLQDCGSPFFSMARFCTD